MATDDERREVARRLRRSARSDKAVSIHIVGRHLGLDMDADYMYGTMCTSESVERLADLVDPDAQAPKGTPDAESGQCPAECPGMSDWTSDKTKPQEISLSASLSMRGSTEEERALYERMVEGNSVELHPVDLDELPGVTSELKYSFDRTALLELADEMDAAYPDSRDVAIEYIEDFARRIREACGEAS